MVDSAGSSVFLKGFLVPVHSFVLILYFSLFGMQT